jgi:hexokinase
MADVPKDLLQEIQRLEELFTVDQDKLKAITKHFVSELAKGKHFQSIAVEFLLISVQV